MTDTENHVVEFYRRHPISSQHILARLREKRGHLEGLSCEDLYPHDQDHYGGLDANAALARLAGMKAGYQVADFCAGLGGPARWWAKHYGVEVTGIELSPDRVRGAEELTRLVGLEGQVKVILGNVVAPPLEDQSFDAVVSQEALLHVADKREALRQAFRILKPGGRLAFSDWIVHQPLSPDESEDMWRGIAAQSLQSVAGYKDLLRDCGLDIVSVDDVTGEWGRILADRLAMYRALREETATAGAPSGDDLFYASYARLVGHVQARKLGGARVTAQRPS